MNVPRPPLQIVTDQAGFMRDDVFYKVSSDAYRTWDYEPAAVKQDCIVLPPRMPLGELAGEPCWLDAHAYQWKESSRKDMLCTNKAAHEHQRQPFVEQLEGDLFGGPHVSDFVIDTTVGWLLVTREFARLLRASTLTGYDLQAFRININQSHVSKIELFHLQGVGQNCERPPHVVGVANLCPHCEGAPVICETCGHRWFTCPECGREMYARAAGHQGSDDRRLLLEPSSRNGGILEGHRWDGADFVSSHDHIYLSKRAFDWMTRIHAGPLIGIPARFCAEDLDSAGKELLEKVTDASTVEK